MFYLAFLPFVRAKISSLGSASRACVFIIIILLRSSNVVAGTTIDLRYEVQWGNLNVGEVEASWVFSGNTYEMVGNSRAVGISDKVSKYRGSSNVKGQIRDGLYTPVKIKIAGAYKGKERNATVFWSAEAGYISTARHPALDLEKVHALDKTIIKGSIDPFTAILRVLHSIKQTGSCNSNHKIYDGLRTAELTFHNLGPAILADDRPNAHTGPVIRCGLTSKPTGGHQLKSRWNKKKRDIDDTIIYVAEIKPSFFLPVRIEIKTFLGKLTARLAITDLSINVS
tara:strand:- start:2988 stop:3836 length:849 start_codon:yes stop_codon:yes gene_type:complete